MISSDKNKRLSSKRFGVNKWQDRQRCIGCGAPIKTQGVNNQKQQKLGINQQELCFSVSFQQTLFSPPWSKSRLLGTFLQAGHGIGLTFGAREGSFGGIWNNGMDQNL